MAKETVEKRSSAKVVAQSKKKTSSVRPDRIELYKKNFVPANHASGEFFEQVNGYGTPFYSQVRSFAGV